MATAQNSVLRKPTPAEELSKLHPFERGLLRIFEFLSSIKFAVFLMAWLMVECTIGTFVEAQANVQAARYFVYGTWRFTFLLGLLALCVTCAALIRFPWKRHQTGFVVTHVGLLLLLFGSMLTARRNLDALMSVAKDKVERKIFDPNYEQLEITYHQPHGESRTEIIPVNFGPFSWGHKLFGFIPWRKNHSEEYELANGDILRVKRYYANCEREATYIPAEKGTPATTALEYRLYAPEFDMPARWIAFDSEMKINSVSLGMGKLLFWQLDTPADERSPAELKLGYHDDPTAELEHFVKAVPKGPIEGLLGVLGYSHLGTHHVFSVDELKSKGAIDVPGTDVKIEWEEFLPNAVLKDGEWVNDGDDPLNPLLRLKVKERDKSNQYLVFGSRHEFSRLLGARFSREHMFTYFPADQPAAIELGITSTGQLGYRAFGGEGLIAARIIEPGKPVPAWAPPMLDDRIQFCVDRIVPNARPDIKLTPKRLPRGETGNHGVVVELERKGKTYQTAGWIRALGPTTLHVGDRVVTFRYGFWEKELPFAIRLDDFEEPTNPGTQQAAMFTSQISLIDAAGKEAEHTITMNAPLYYTDADGNDYTFYQSGIDRSSGVPVSTFTVADDPGLVVKYVGAAVLCTGIFLMFYMGHYFKRSKLVVARQGVPIFY